MNRPMKTVGICLALLIGSACSQDDQITRDTKPYDGIGESETVTLVGTEPFWTFVITGESAVYTSPEDLEGTTITLSRFAGNNGISFSGELNDAPVEIVVTPGECSDGMSDRNFPFTATIKWGERTLYGCGHTDSQPFSDPEVP
ncbi:MAG: hypothetical protein AAF687_04770 [Pseudomonadota bacterium]